MDQNRSKRDPKGASVQGSARGHAADINNENSKPQTVSGKSAIRQNEKNIQDPKKSDTASATPSVSAKGPQPTADQLRMANLFQGSQITDTILQEKTLKVQELTSCTMDAAVVALHDCNNNVEEAVNLLLERGPESDEWEKIEKNGKPKKKAKSKKAEDEDGEDRQNVPFGMSGKRGPGDRGRPAQRGGSSRGGKSFVQSTQRSAINSSQDAVSNSINGSRNQGNTRERPSSPQNGKALPSGETRIFEGQKGRDEPTWDDDDWKEEIRETKVFTRSSNNLPPANAFNAPANQQPQPANNVGGAGPTFSAMVQKHSAWSAANAPAASGQRQSTESSNWRPPGGTAAPTQKPPGASSGAMPDTNLVVPASSGVAPSLSNASAPQSIKPDISQLGAQLGSMVFNRSDADSPSEFTIPSQTQTYNSSRNTFTDIASGGSLQSSLEFTPSRRNDIDSSTRQASTTSGPLGATELHRPQIGQNSGGSAFGPPSVQSQAYNNSQTADGPMNPYSNRNIQSSAFVQPLPSKPAPAFDNANFFAPPLQSPSSNNMTQQSSLSGPGPSASGDARFGQTPSGLNLQKPQAVSPQNPVKFGGNAVGSASYPPPATAQRVPPSNQNSGPVSSQNLSQSAQGHQTQHHEALQQSMHSQQLPMPSPSKAASVSIPSGSYYGNAGGDATSRNTAFSAFSSHTASGQGMGSGKEMASSVQHQPQQNMQQQQNAQSQPNQLATTISPQRSVGSSNTTPVYASTKPIPSVSNSKSPYGSQPSMTQSVMNQQPYLTQQGAYAQLNPMFQQMGYGGMDAITDPRLVMPQGMTLESSYQYAMSPRDPTGLGYSSNPDYNKYRTDPVLGSQQVQVSQQQQQPPMVAPHLNQYPGAYQVYSPSVPQNYQFPGSQQMYSGMQSNYKSNATMGSSYPANNFADMAGLSDVNKTSSAYLRSGGSDSYGNAGMLSSGVDMNAAYGYGSKPTNKFEKPSQAYGMQMGSQQAQQYQPQYFPMMQQPQLHGMPQVQQGSTMSGQNLANSKQNKGPMPNHQYWGTQ